MDILIRPYQLEDVDPLLAAVLESLDELLYWMPWCSADYHRGESDAWVKYAISAWEKKREYAFVIESGVSVNKSERRNFLGCVGLHCISTQRGTAKLGYWVRTSLHNRGIATRAALLACQFAFSQLGLTRIDVEIADGNDASRAVAVKLGAIYEGCIHNKLIRGNNTLTDAHCYTLIPSDLIFSDLDSLP